MSGPNRSISAATLCVAGFLLALTSVGTDAQKTPARGLIRNLPPAFPGFTVVAPLRSTSTFLVNMDGEVVHEWRSRYTPTFGVHVLANGNLLRAGRDPRNPHFQVGGQGGIVQEIAWDSTVVWEYVYSNRQHVQHHDIEPLPNGNVLLLGWERKTAHEAVLAGRNPQLISGTGIWPEHLIEVQPVRPTGGRIVWEWHLWDHLVQNRDPALRDYGAIDEHPELVDINGGTSHRRESEEELARLRALGYIVDAPRGTGPQTQTPVQTSDWNHANSISFNPELDHIAISVLRFSEIWIIDHSTTTEEAAGHRGGNGSRGGDLLYRVGNPQAFRGSTSAAQRWLYGQHDARWIPKGLPGAGHLTVFNNGRGRPDGEYSSVDEIRLQSGASGSTASPRGRSNAAAEIVWSYAGTSTERFFSGHISGAERLPNGNTLVCLGEEGRIFEVTQRGTIVWDYLNPIGGDVTDRLPPWVPAGADGPAREDEPYGLLRSSRLPRDHPGLTRLAKQVAR